MSKQIQQAIELLNNGELVVFPTETVYGLGADAENAHAVPKIFQVKQRPTNHPLILHLANANELSSWVTNITPQATLLMQNFCPGPLTLIMSRSARVLDCVTGGKNTVGIRFPNHPIAQELLQGFGRGIVAPSANSFGKLSPTSSQHIDPNIASQVGMILDGGRSQCGLESTIIDVSTEIPNVLRFGAISINAIKEVLGENNFTILHHSNVSAPGTLPAHYAPHTRLIIVESKDLFNTVKNTVFQKKRIAVLAYSHKNFDAKYLDSDFDIQMKACINWFYMPNNPQKYAYEMFDILHQADKLKCDVILVEQTPQDSDWLAVNDRLAKAEYGTKVEMLR